MASALLFLIIFFQNCFSLFLDLSTGESVWGLVGHIFIHTAYNFLQESSATPYQKYFFPKFPFSAKVHALASRSLARLKEARFIKAATKNIRYKIPVFFIEKCEEIYTDALQYHGSAARTN